MRPARRLLCNQSKDKTMILITINDSTELAIYKHLEVYAIKGQAIRELLKQLDMK